MSEKTQASQFIATMMGQLLSDRMAESGATVARRAVAMLAMVWLVSGYAHNILHDENRAKQGEEARKSSAEARLGDAMASLEKSFSELAALEEASARDRATYLFDLELRIVSRAPSLTSKFVKDSNDIDGLQTVVQTRLETLGLNVKTPEDLKEFRSMAPKFQARQRALETTLTEFRGTVGHQFEDCVGIFAASSDPKGKGDTASNQFLYTIAANRQEVARTKFPALINDCKKIEEVLAKLKDFLVDEGNIKVIQTRLDRIERDILRYEIDMRRARVELNDTMVKFRDSGVEAATMVGEKSQLVSLETRVAQLRDTVKSVGEGTAAFGAAGAHVAAAEKLKHLQAVLEAIAGSSTEDERGLREFGQCAKWEPGFTKATRWW